jgi:hypothetical protein
VLLELFERHGHAPFEKREHVGDDRSFVFFRNYGLLGVYEFH